MKHLFTIAFCFFMFSHVSQSQCIDRTLIDSTAFCPSIYAPVCGCDFVTYDNSCLAEKLGGVTSWTTGPCAAGSCAADFSTSISGCTVTFGDLSGATGTITGYSWDFDDGSTSTMASPTHTYTSPGTYLVCLTIYTDDSCVDTECDTITVSCPSSPSCSALFDGFATWCTGVFYDRSITSGSITSYAWDFGDGGTSSLANPTHSYSSAGGYYVCLTIITDDSCTDTYCDSIFILCTDDSACTADFSWTFGAPYTTDFTDMSSSSTAIVNWNWTFGDGGTSTMMNPSHSYASGGTYNVCLSIEDSAGCTDSVCYSVYWRDTSSSIENITSITDIELFPNPTTGQTRLLFDLEEATDAQIGIFSLDGKRVISLHDGFVSQGKQAIDFDMNEIHSQGMYLLQIKTPLGTINRTLSFIR